MQSSEEKRGPGRPPKPRTLPVKLIKGYWPASKPGKCLAGDEIELPADEARAAVERGIAVRNDSF